MRVVDYLSRMEKRDDRSEDRFAAVQGLDLEAVEYRIDELAREIAEVSKRQQETARDFGQFRAVAVFIIAVALLSALWDRLF
jgi:hypothetical protein